MKTNFYASLLILVAVATAIFVQSEAALVQVFPSLSGDTLSVVQWLLSVITGLLSSMPISTRKRTIFAGDPTDEFLTGTKEKPEVPVPALWAVFTWLFKLIFTKKK